MSGETVLVAENDSTDILLLRRAFRKAGMASAIRAVANGEQAIRYLAGRGDFADRARHPLPALMLLDIRLPRRSGFEVLAWVREQPEFRRLPVIMLSSSGDAADIARAYDAGANAYHVKPAGFDDLLRLVEALNRYWFVWAEPHAQVRRVNELLDGPMVIPAARLSLKSKVYAILKRHPEGLTVEQLADLLPPGGRATDEPPASVARLADVLRALESAVSYLKVARSGDGRYRAIPGW